MERTPVKRSSNVASFGYDEGTKTLEVEFIGGKVYRFADVSPETHDAFRGAESAGKFLRTLSKGVLVE